MNSKLTKHCDPTVEIQFKSAPTQIYNLQSALEAKKCIYFSRESTIINDIVII